MLIVFSVAGPRSRPSRPALAVHCLLASVVTLPVLMISSPASASQHAASSSVVNGESVRTAVVVTPRTRRAVPPKVRPRLKWSVAKAGTVSKRVARPAAAPTAAPVSPVTPVATAVPRTPVPTAVPTATAPATSMPGAAAGPWRRVFQDDFTTPVPLGNFMTSSYRARWDSYDGFGDTSGVGTYSPGKVLSVQNGALDYYLHTENGKPLGAAPVPLIGGKWTGQVYGRWSMRFRADNLPGFGNGWLLWSDENNWNDGEIDFAEGGLDGTIHSFNHCVGAPQKNCLVVDTGKTWQDWHTATVEWTPSAVTFFLDGKQTGRSTSVPTASMHAVLQTATTGVRPAASTAGHVQIDWITIDTYQP